MTDSFANSVFKMRANRPKNLHDYRIGRAERDRALELAVLSQRGPYRTENILERADTFRQYLYGSDDAS